VITIVATLKAADGKADALQAVLTQMVSDVKTNEAGRALAYSLHTKDGEPGTFLFYEQYADDDAVAAHGKTDHMRTMGRAIRDQGLVDGAPVIERYTKVAGV
jgi:quinol monooxygenase YgiN